MYFLKEMFSNSESKNYKIIHIFLAIITIFSILSLTLETIQSFSKYDNIFYWIEIGSVMIFSLEYIGRIISTKNTFQYIFSFFGFVDLLSIIPTYLGLWNLTFLKSTRFLRVLKSTRLSKNKKKLEDFVFLNLEIFLIFFVVSTFFSAISIWLTEGYRDEFSNIPLSILWSIKVLLGGLGQLPPKTFFGDNDINNYKIFRPYSFGIVN